MEAAIIILALYITIRIGKWLLDPKNIHGGTYDN